MVQHRSPARSLARDVHGEACVVLVEKMEERTNVSVIAEDAALSASPSSVAPTSRAEIVQCCPVGAIRHVPFVGPAISDSEVSAQRRRPVPGIKCVQALSSEETQTISH